MSTGSGVTIIPGDANHWSVVFYAPAGQDDSTRRLWTVLVTRSTGHACTPYRQPRADARVRRVRPDIGRPLLLFVMAGTDLSGAVLATDALGGAFNRAAPWVTEHRWSTALGVGVLAGLLAGSIDLATDHELVGVLLHSVLWAVIGALLQVLTLAIIDGAAAGRARSDRTEHSHGR